MTEYGEADRARIRAEATARMEALSSSALQLEPAIRLFAQDVAQHGLWDRIHESRARGMRGTFSGTTLMSYVLAGRVMLTLASEAGDVTLIGTEDDNRAGIFPVDPANIYRIGLKSIGCPDHTAIAMLNTISTQWPPDPDAQRRIFHDDNHVTLDVLAAQAP